jgi:SPASM domain peptide maturase of grasp-with-spasm system
MTEKKLALFGNCVTVKGFNRSLVVDFQSATVDFMPNDLYSILSEHQGKTRSEIKAAYTNQFDETIDEYLDFLKTNNYIFWTNEPECFPAMQKKWIYPGEISNVLIDIVPESPVLTKDRIIELEELGCIAAQIRSKEYISLLELERILTLFQNTRFQSIELILPYSEEYTEEVMTELCARNLRVTYIILHSSPKSGKIEGKLSSFFYMEEDMEGSNSCGPRSPAHLAFNKQLYMEAQFHNTYLNKKIHLNALGEIRNSPEALEVVGNCKQNTLKEICNNPEFKKNWHICKDEIRVCKDCEFRYFCVDSRIPQKDSSTGEYFHESKCNYDPYSNEWKA